MKRNQLNILVAGMFAGQPHHGGATWAVLQYVLGLRQLGHDVYLLEHVQRPSKAAKRYFDSVVAQFRIVGELVSTLRPLDGFDVVINCSGMLAVDALTRIPVRVYLDLDPAFNQLWHEDGIDMHYEGHTHFVTIGQSIGTAECAIPTHGIEWIPTVPPVVLGAWPTATAIHTSAFTTVANFRGYGSISRGGQFYGQKVHSLRDLVRLPTLTQERFVLAMTVHPDEREDLVGLAANGWELIDPTSTAGTPDEYRKFIRGSRAEIGIAKSGYVVSRCGWFSDRRACYLAAGRPVIAQALGFFRFLPTGQGLFAFTNEVAAVAVGDALRRDYARHARAARQLAEEYLDSDRVLGHLLRQVMA